MLLDTTEIQKILPHRYPFLMVDAIEEMERVKRIVGIKNVTINEAHFQGHFPGKPIMPGVLIIESMAQTGGLLLLLEIPDREKKLLYFVAIDGARFRRPVVPGEQLKIEVKVVTWRGDFCKLDGKATVNGELAAEATLMCKMVDREVFENTPASEIPRQEPVSRSRAGAGPAAWNCCARISAAYQREIVNAARDCQIDTHAIVAPGARVGARVKIGAYAVVGEHVELGEGCMLHAHAVVQGPAKIGQNNVLHPFCSVGGDPQDLKFHGEQTELTVGDGNTFREFVTVSRGTVGGGGKTTIGSGSLFMAYAHVAHDCHVGNETIFANGATLAGHVTVEDFATIGAFFSGAPILQDRAVCVYRRVDGDHAGCAAVFAGGYRARDEKLRD